MGCGLSSVEMVKFGMFSVATVGVVHIGEALEVDSIIDMKRELTDRTNLFACPSAWGWRSDGSLWIDGEKMKEDKIGLEPLGAVIRFSSCLTPTLAP